MCSALNFNVILGGKKNQPKQTKLKKEEITELPLSFCFPQSALVLIFIDILRDNNMIQVWMLEWKGKIQLKMNSKEIESISAYRYRYAVSGI